MLLRSASVQPGSRQGLSSPSAAVAAVTAGSLLPIQRLHPTHLLHLGHFRATFRAPGGKAQTISRARRVSTASTQPKLDWLQHRARGWCLTLLPANQPGMRITQTHTWEALTWSARRRLEKAPPTDAILGKVLRWRCCLHAPTLSCSFCPSPPSHPTWPQRNRPRHSHISGSTP